VKYLLGYDIGSSSIKAALLDAASGKPVATAFSPAVEMQILAKQPGFAEQDPEVWWDELIEATQKIKQQFFFQPDQIISIGISYQMHGLVCIDKNQKPLRPAIIWCDSRAVETGNRAFHELGEAFCLQHFLNSPGNFTASKLKWVKDNEPDLYERIHKVLLPGDYVAMKMTGEAVTTLSGLSEGIFWDYRNASIADSLLDFYKIDRNLLAPQVPTFGEQGRLLAGPAAILGLTAGIPVSYRAGDQPNNAYSLNVLQPGEIAATAGTSGVIYGVTDKTNYDQQSRVNAFIHVNHAPANNRLGILLCVNGTGILNSWLRKHFFPDWSYKDMNEAAATVPIGSEGLQFLPFGNGAERMLVNKDPGARLLGLQFNRHQRSHIARAAQEGIVFALNFGAEIMREMGMQLTTVRAGYANMFLSEVFATTFANVSNCSVEMYNTDGALGAARAAGVGAGFYRNFKESFTGMQVIKKIDPDARKRPQTLEAYDQWKKAVLDIQL
jgi:xylulokinase